ncbi:MAG TPA: CHAT domain-containing protein [Candidatus Polarisedimenticolia bacterium]|nr:CHAT domain-containing protein [Candidatus Polarisedimenticolia bacterium]
MNDALELLILDSGEPTRAVVYARFGGDTAIEFLSCQLIREFKRFRDRLNDAAGGQGARPTAVELRDFGRRLFEFVVHSKLLAVYTRLPAEYVRIQVLSNQPDLQALPWEYLQEPDAPAGPNNARGVVRIVPTIGMPTPRPRHLKARVRLLFAYADPIDQGPVAWEDIQATITRDFSSRLGKALEIDVIEGTSTEALTKALSAKPYDILHFNGHGAVVRDAENREAGHLILVDPRTGKRDPLSAERLALLVTGSNLQLVILSACSSSSGDFSREYAVVAQALVDRGVPAVVANQFPVTNSVAATFASGLYTKLLQTGDIDEAVANGRLMLAMQPPMGQGAQLEWGIPTLYRHVGAAQIFTP